MEIWEDCLGWHPAPTVCLICFSVRTIIRIWEPAEGGMAVYGEKGFDRSIHNIENSPFRTKFEKESVEMHGNLGIGCISDNEPQPLMVRSHLGTFE